jgi:hypothetical protein
MSVGAVYAPNEPTKGWWAHRFVDRAQSLLEREGPRYRLMPSWCSSYKTHHLRPSLTIGVNYDPVPLFCDVYLLRIAFVGGSWVLDMADLGGGGPARGLSHGT